MFTLYILLPVILTLITFVGVVTLITIGMSRERYPFDLTDYVLNSTAHAFIVSATVALVSSGISYTIYYFVQ